MLPPPPRFFTRTYERENPMEILNTKANPPILVRYIRSKSSNKLGKMVFLDPKDEGRFDPKDLTPLEKGKILQYVPYAGKVRLYLPYRFMCGHLIKALSGLTSVSVESPSLLPTVSPMRLSKRLSFCLQDFSLSSKDWGIAKQRVESIQGWSVEPFSIDLNRIILSKVCILSNINKSLQDLTEVKKRCSVLNEEEFDLEGTLKMLDCVSNLRHESRVQMMSLARLTVKLPMASPSDRGVVTSIVDELKEGIDSLDKIDLSRYEREAIHKSKYLNDRKTTPNHLRGLKEELEELKIYFPALRFLEASGNSVTLTIGDVKITMEPEEVSIKGEVSSLSRYTEGSLKVAKKGGSRRFSSILRSEK